MIGASGGPAMRGPDHARPAGLALAALPARQHTRQVVPRAGRHIGRTGRIAIVAIARKLLITLWRFTETGEIPDGVVIKAA